MLAAICLVAGCGGGNGGSSQPQSPAAGGTPPAQTPQPQPSGIGAGGGVVTGAAGAQVSIPAGALSQNVDIVIAQSDEGAPALPEGLTAVGEIFAFTPHGTTFAAPVTVTVPFDPAQLPQGTEPALFKTGPGQAEWEAVENATVDASAMVGEVNGFSYFVVAFSPVTRTWIFTTHRSDDSSHHEAGIANGGVLRESRTFGEMTIAPPDRDLIASGEAYSNATGNTYWVEAEAPIGDVSRPTDTVGSETYLNQMQFFRKNEAGAALRFRITQAWIGAIDRNGPMPIFNECPWAEGTGPAEICKDEVFGELDLKIVAVMMDPGPPLNPDPGLDVPEAHEVFAAHQGSVRLWGWQENWDWKVHTDVVYEYENIRPEDVGPTTELHYTVPIFEEGHFEYTKSNTGPILETDASVRLLEPVTVDIDLSRIPIGATFRIITEANALAHNRRGYELSYVGARLRDPVELGGVEVESTGLTPVAPLESAQPWIVDEPECPAEGVSENSGTVQFSATHYSLPEFSPTSGGVFVTRTGGSEGTMIVEVTGTDGTAVGGVHYTPFTRTLVFGDGDTTPRSIRIPIVNDDVDDEDDRTINLLLTSTRNCANLGEPEWAVATIIDDETPPPTTFNVGGTLSGLSGSGLSLEDVTTGERIFPANGPFWFDYLHPDGSSYDVRVVTQPSQPQQICTVSNGSGVIAGANAMNVSVTCADAAVSATLDPTFGVGGRVTSGLPGGGRALALQSDGKILALSRSQLARFNDDGTLDTTFGTGGVISTAFIGVLGEESRDVAVQSDGRIIVVGYTRASPTVLDYDFAISRYNSDGTLDGTFGENGIVTIDLYGRVDQAHRVAIQADDRIVVGGHAEWLDSSDPFATSETSFAVVRLTASGSLDTTFGADPPFVGTGMQTAFGGRALAYALAIAPDGKVVLGGRVGSDGADPPAAGLARWSSNGVADTNEDSDPLIYLGLDGSGSGTASLGDSNVIEDLIATEDGSLVGVMNNTMFGRSRFMLVQFAVPFGTMQNRPPPFAYTDVPIGPHDDVMTALTRQGDGKFIVVGGVSSAQTVGDFGIVRFNADRSLDASFGTNGVLTIDFFGAADTANDVVVQPDGKIVVLGVARNGTSNGLGLVRILQ